MVVEMTVCRASPFPFFPPSVENTEAVATLTTPFLEPGGQNENRFLLVEVEKSVTLSWMELFLFVLGWQQ